jgi:hypothetical protein
MMMMMMMMMLIYWGNINTINKKIKGLTEATKDGDLKVYTG